MWTAKDFVDAPTKNTIQSNDSSKGKWSASDFTNTNMNKPSQTKVMASPTPKPVQKVPKITQPTKTFDFW
jgi:hypothetical protein